MIGWYVHHQGRGHLTRANAIASVASEPITVLSSLPEPVDSVFAAWVQLEPDTDVDDSCGDPTANGLLHWAPVTSYGIPRRMAQIADWIAESRPSSFVVDVSVEVTALARLCGAPLVVIAGPGDRDDCGHQLAYGMAELIIAAWPREVYQPSSLAPYEAKTRYIGGISRYDRRPDGPSGHGGVLVLNGAGGSAVTAQGVLAAQESTGQPWTGLGLPGADWVEDVWPHLHAADVVVTHAGQNALADVAAARRPAVIVPQTRAFGEQDRIATAIDLHGLAVTSPTWPKAAEWTALLDRARALGGSGWQRWSTGTGAITAAELICRAGR